jgi:Helix-turn-helix domain
MKLRDQKRYKQDDWKVRSQFGEQVGDAARLVDVVVGSPAWRAGFHTGTWVLLMNEMAFDLFERSGAVVGAVVNVKAYIPGVGHVSRNLILGDLPKAGRPCKPASQNVPCGQRVEKRDRPKWLMRVTESRQGTAAIAVATRLATKHARANAEAFPSVRTLSKDLVISESSVKRALDKLHAAGFVDVRSGRKIGRSNLYTLTWPAPARSI